MKANLILIIIFFISCKSVFYNNKSKIAFNHNKNSGIIVINNDSFKHKLFQKELVQTDNNVLIIFDKNKLYSYNYLYGKLDSVKLKLIDSIEGYKYDNKLKIIVVWQKKIGAFESFRISNLKVYNSIFMHRSDLIDMNYSINYGFVFIQNQYYTNTNTFAIYPVVKENQNRNEVFNKLEKRTPIQKFCKFSSFGKYWVSIKDSLNKDSIIVFPDKIANKNLIKNGWESY